MASFGPPPQLTRDDLVAVLERNFPDHWIEGLLADPSSLSLFEGTIADLLRIQDSWDENFYTGCFILSAPGRARATSTVRLARASGAAVTIGTDIRFQDDRGALWLPVASFNVPASGIPQIVDVPIHTDRVGYYLNSFGVLAYEAIDDLPIGFTIVAGSDPASGGVTPFLDQHGKERRVHRSAGETDQQYRNRIRFLEDQVSPKAIAQTVVEVLDGFAATKSIAYYISRFGLAAAIEPFKDGSQPTQRGLKGSQTAFADDFGPVPVAAPTPYAGGTFADDTATELRDVEDGCAWFDVRIPTPVDPNEARQFYDDVDPARGAFVDDPLYGFFDQPTPEAVASPIAALADELDRRRAHCVRFRIIVGDDVALLRHPELTTLAQVGGWTDEAGGTTDADMVEALGGFDADYSYATTSTGAGPGAALAAGDLAFNLPTVPVPNSVTRVLVRAQVRAEAAGAGVDPELQFLLRPSTAGAAQRVGGSYVVDHEDYRELGAIFDQNPITAAAWTLADVGSTFGVGVANVAAVGPTEELRVSELILELVLNYG